MERLGRLVEAIGMPDELTVLEAIYEGMPSRNFSSDLLEHAVPNVAVLEMQEIFWCDWGKPERILDTLGWLGKNPAFPPEIVNDKLQAQPLIPPAVL
jgi:hypothetical protein